MPVQPSAPDNPRYSNAPEPLNPVEEPAAVHPAIQPGPARQAPAPTPASPQQPAVWEEPTVPQAPVSSAPSTQQAPPQRPYSEQEPPAQHAPMQRPPAESAPMQPPIPPPLHQGPVQQRGTVQHPAVPQQRFGSDPTIMRPDAGEPLWGQGAPQPQPASYQKRGFGIFAAVAAVLAAVIAVAALVFVLANRGGDAGDNSDVPTLGGAPPTGVRIVDKGASIKVSWVDPTSGTVSFLVAMGHPGEQLKPVTTLGPGQTSYEVSALNPGLNYCFAVVAVYRNNQFATSQQACTDRPTK